MEDIGETLDPALEPVLQKTVVDNGGRKQIKIGDSDVDYDPIFLLYMTTKMPNPHYHPEVCIKVTVINFSITFAGLEEQLLNATAQKEIPATVQKRTDLMLSLADDKKILQKLEDEILRLLSESSGNILDDEVLISALAKSKETANTVNERVALAEITAAEIESTCDKYLPVATNGSILYFVIADLANINPMYQFSLFYFNRLFHRCFDMAQPAEELAERMCNLVSTITATIFLNVCYGLFEDNKLIFSFLIAASQQRQAMSLEYPGWSLLLRGIGRLDFGPKPLNPDPDYPPE